MTEALQVYPVAGAQLAMGALCLVPVGAIMVNDGIRQLREVRSASPWQFVASVAPAALVANVLVYLLFANAAATGFRAATPLGVSGAESIRVSAEQASQLHSFTAATDRDCSEFITMPGMNSLYLWTAQSQPTNVRSEIWMLNFDSGQTTRRLPRLCVVMNQKAVDFWAQGRLVPNRPLVDFISVGLVNAGTFGDHQLLVRRDE